MFCKGSKSYKEWDYDGGNGNYSHHRLSLNLNLGDFDSVIMRCCWCGLATGILREHQTHLNLPKSFYLCADSALVHYILYPLMMPFQKTHALCLLIPYISGWQFVPLESVLAADTVEARYEWAGISPAQHSSTPALQYCTALVTVDTLPQCPGLCWVPTTTTTTTLYFMSLLNRPATLLLTCSTTWTIIVMETVRIKTHNSQPSRL